VTATPPSHGAAALLPTHPPRTDGWQVRCWLDHHQHLLFQNERSERRLQL